MTGSFEGMSWAESAREVEALGYSTLFVPDHFHEGYGPITAMATAAAATTTLKVGPMVLACDFRHPAVLSRELASIDQLSRGRLEVGLGAGYQETDYDRTGIAMDPPGIRVERLMEHVRVLKLLFGAGPVNFTGRHYEINDLDGTPKPFRAGGPPIIIAGGGERMLRFAATAADIIGVNPKLPSAKRGGAAGRDALGAAIDTKFGWIRDAAGARFEQLEFTAWLSVAAITDDPTAIAERIGRRFDAAADEVLASPIFLLGSEAEVVDRLHERRKRWGYSYHVVQGDKAHEFAPVVRSVAGT